MGWLSGLIELIQVKLKQDPMYNSFSVSVGCYSPPIQELLGPTSLVPLAAPFINSANP